MSRRQITQFRAFDFQSDFSAPGKAPVETPMQTAASSLEEDTVSLPVMEIAALGAQLQAQATEAACAPIDDALAKRIESAAERLSAAMEQLSELAVALDLAARMGQVPPTLAPVAERAARSLADGQGDLFAACKSLTDTSGR